MAHQTTIETCGSDCPTGETHYRWECAPCGDAGLWGTEAEAKELAELHRSESRPNIYVSGNYDPLFLKSVDGEIYR